MRESTPTAKEPIPELVLLMQEPLIVDAAFLRSAYESVLNIKLGSDTEFVTGQFPFFMFQAAGVLVYVTVAEGKYGNADYREAFPHHDLSAAQSSLGFFERRRIARHKGWIAASLLREREPTGLNPYVHVGRALCPFALPDAAVGLIAPTLRKTVLFSEDHQELLRAGDVRQIFGI